MTAQTIPQRLTFTAEELAEALHLAPATVRLRCQRGIYAARKDGKLWRIPRREYIRLVGEGDEVPDARRTRDPLIRENERLREALRRISRDVAAVLGEDGLNSTMSGHSTSADN